MGRFAENTTVAAERSRDEIEATLVRYGAGAFMYGWEEQRAVVQFRMADRLIRFDLPMPDRNERRFTHHARGARTESAAIAAWEQATRQRWRALALVVKAKLEAVESGITTFEHEFLAHIVLPDGSTVGQWAGPQVAEAYLSGAMPKLLPATTGGDA